MWHKIQEDPPYLLQTRNLNSYEIYITDYVTIWFVYFKKNIFLECLKESNFGLEVEAEELLQKGTNLLKNPTDLKKLDIEKQVTTLKVSMSKVFEYKLQLKLTLTEGSKEMFFQNVTHLLLKAVTDLQTSEQKLRNLLKKKDDEIEEYKCEGKEIALRYLKTKQFDDKEHMKHHQAYKECNALIEIPESILDKLAATSYRNESMYKLCADAIHCLKQVVRLNVTRRVAVYACFLEVKKNLNRVSYGKLWNRMRSNSDVPDEIVVTFDYFYKNRIDMKERTRLFNPYLYCLIERLRKFRFGCYVSGTKYINHISYGDNLVLLGPTLGTISGLLMECDNYSKRHGFKFDVDASKLLVFQSPRVRKIANLQPVYLYGEPLARVSHFNYLGYRLSEYLSDSEDFSDMDSDDFSNDED